MKINLTIDATPEEVRRALGLPVMNDVHQAVMDQMSDQVKKGTVDPEKVMEMLGPSMKAGQQIMETFLKGMVCDGNGLNDGRGFEKKIPF